MVRQVLARWVTSEKQAATGLVAEDQDSFIQHAVELLVSGEPVRLCVVTHYPWKVRVCNREEMDEVVGSMEDALKNKRDDTLRFWSVVLFS